jgi:hypothetical protein
VVDNIPAEVRATEIRRLITNYLAQMRVIEEISWIDDMPK